MNAATEGADQLLNGPDASFETECSSLRDRHSNLLLEGPAEVTDALLFLLRPHLREPILWKRSGAPLDLPADQGDTLVLRDVAALSADEQQRLLRWLEEKEPPRQVVSTTTIPVFPLVAHGLFDSVLYYRLNVMLLQVDSRTVAAARVLLVR
jgi:hypothetical protein